jgi:hypothetical protein
MRRPKSIKRVGKKKYIIIMESKEKKSIKIVKENENPKGILSFSTAFFMTDKEKSKIVGGIEEEPHCRRGYRVEDGFKFCKCGYIG